MRSCERPHEFSLWWRHRPQTFSHPATYSSQNKYRLESPTITRINVLIFFPKALIKVKTSLIYLQYQSLPRNDPKFPWFFYNQKRLDVFLRAWLWLFPHQSSGWRTKLEQRWKPGVQSCQGGWGWSARAHSHVTPCLLRKAARWRPPRDSTQHWRILDKEKEAVLRRIRGPDSFIWPFSWMKVSWIKCSHIS